MEIPEFIMPVTSLLLPPSGKEAWSGMRLIGTLRHERGIAVPQKKDSLYKPVEHPTYVGKPLVVPKELKQSLPFRATHKHLAKPEEQKRVAVVLEPHEQKVANFMKRVKAVYKDKVSKDRREMIQRSKQYKKKIDALETVRQEKLKEAKKRLHKILGDLKKDKEKSHR